MFGWEFPPFSSGGLGTACHGLTKGLVNHGIDLTFVIPKAIGEDFNSHVRLIGADNLGGVTVKQIDSIMTPYDSSYSYIERYKKYAGKGTLKTKNVYGKNLFEEVHRYAERAKIIASLEHYDVIHAHDWLTFPAAIKAKEVLQKPLVVHVHATEHDRTGGNGVNQGVYDIERMGMHMADKVITVSNFTKQKVVDHYGVDPAKIEVVHNAVELGSNRVYDNKSGSRIVLFLGRVTLQKGPDYFLEAAKMVADVIPDVRFVIAGSGDMCPAMIEKAAHLGIGDKIHFTGFLQGEDIHKMYQMADLYVMPSVSEPFGITPLEALSNNTPVLISKQSGVSEVLNHALKTDFWDVRDIASKIISVLHHKELHGELLEHGSREVQKFDWNEPATKCISVYNQMMEEAK